MRAMTALIVLGMFATVATSRAASEPSTQGISVTDVKGDARVRHGAAWKPLKPGDPLSTGDQVKTGEEGSMAILVGSETFTLAPLTQATISLDGFADVVTSNAPPPVTASGDYTAAGAVRGRRGEVQLISPCGTSVDSAHPLFRWKGLAGVRAYDLKVTDALDTVLFHTHTQETSVRYGGHTPLAAGHTYFWAVKAEGKALGFSPPQYFQVGHAGGSAPTQEGQEPARKADPEAGDDSE